MVAACVGYQCETALGAEVGLALGVGHLGEAGQGGGGREALRVVGEVEGDAPAGAGRGYGRGGRVDGLEGRVPLVTLRREARVRGVEGDEGGEGRAGRRRRALAISSLSLSLLFFYY